MIENVQLYRMLADEDPGTFLPRLASAVENQRIWLWEAGRRQEALAPAVEAAELYRALAERDPDRYRADLARNLTNLGSDFGGAPGRPAPNWRPSRRPCTCAGNWRRRWTTSGSDPNAFGANLAFALVTWQRWLRVDGRDDEGREVGAESIEVFRRVVATLPQPGNFEAEFADALFWHASDSVDIGGLKEAHDCAEEAVTVWQRLADHGRGSTEASARALQLLAVVHLMDGRPAEALARGEAGVTLAERLAATDPPRHSRLLSGTLLTLARVFASLGRDDDARAAHRRSQDAARRAGE